jgi:hypothetical protein
VKPVSRHLNKTPDLWQIEYEFFSDTRTRPIVKYLVIPVSWLPARYQLLKLNAGKEILATPNPNCGYPTLFHPLQQCVDADF